jgi:prolyl oligopeptidase
VRLSRGSTEANVMREFDLKTKAFVPPSEGGFMIPEACNRVSWRDRDTLFVATDFGPGSITDSGYPRFLKEWKRGTPLSEAGTVFEGKQSDMVVRAERFGEYNLILNEINFFDYDAYILRNGELIKIHRPHFDNIGLFQGQLILYLKREWTVYDKVAHAYVTYPANSIVSANFEKYLAGDHGVTMVFRGDERQPVINAVFTKNYCVLNILENLRSHIYACRFNATSGAWETTDVPLRHQPGTAASDSACVSISSANGSVSDDIFITTQDMITPPANIRQRLGESPGQMSRQESRFSATGMEYRRHDAVSQDGTKIPYFVATPKNFRADGGTPTILLAYGGLGMNILPAAYHPEVGKGWLERGGVFVVAGTRGGGEFGPKWHEAGTRENRQNSFDDLAAVARDLIARKITSPEHLGIMGKSNGGLLVSVAFEQHPELYSAVVSQAPPLDLRRYTKLLVGKRWMIDMGDPDLQKDWAFLKKFSPYQNVKPASHVKYPRVLFTASTNDDRVHPAHARKMAALMEEKGHDVLYYESAEGGHDGPANAGQRAYLDALIFTFFAKELGLK